MIVKSIIKRVVFLTGIKKPLLATIRWINSLLRFVTRKSHYLEMAIDWSFKPNPEWFNHYLDIYYRWHVDINPFWVERGVFGLLAIKENANILELCCGDGFNTKYFYSAKAAQIIAIDYDAQAISHARRYNSMPNIGYVIGDILTAMPESSFDNIVWDAAIEHFTESQIETLIGRIRDRLSAGGILSGYTIVEKEDGGKYLDQHEYEFSSKEDLLRFLTPYFKNVKVFETKYPERHNLYFYASDAILPFDQDWEKQAIKSHENSSV